MPLSPHPLEQLLAGDHPLPDPSNHLPTGLGHIEAAGRPELGPFTGGQAGDQAKADGGRNGP